jgi:hypothetical protein
MGKGKNDEEQVDISQDMKSKVQPSQDNRDPMVKKIEKGATVTCYKCHGEGHKFYKCPQFVKKMDKGTKKKFYKCPQFDFLFYDFSVIYYDFSKLLQGVICPVLESSGSKKIHFHRLEGDVFQPS